MLSRKNKSPFLSAFGKGYEIFKALIDEFKNQGGDDEDVSLILIDPDLRREMVALAMAKKQSGQPQPIRPTFPIVVDYSLSLAQMIQAGKYDWVNSDIADHFPVKGEGQQEMEITLFHFNRSISSEKAIEEMDKAEPSFRPANPAELLSLGAAQPELQRQFPIIALGQFWTDPNGYRDVVVLLRNDAERYLDLSWCGRDWRDVCRFAAVRK